MYIPQWNRSREQLASFVTFLTKTLIVFTSKMAAAFIIVHLWDWVSGFHANPLRSINFTRSLWKWSKHQLPTNAAFIFVDNIWSIIDQIWMWFIGSNIYSDKIEIYLTGKLRCVSTLYIQHHVYIWQVSLELSFGETCQMWRWFKESNRYFCKIENFAYGKLTNGVLVTPPQINCIARTHGCVQNDRDRRSWKCNPVTPVKSVSLSFRTHPCVLAFITHISCMNGIEMALMNLT